MFKISEMLLLIQAIDVERVAEKDEAELNRLIERLILESE